MAAPCLGPSLGLGAWSGSVHPCPLACHCTRSLHEGGPLRLRLSYWGSSSKPEASSHHCVKDKVGGVEPLLSYGDGYSGHQGLRLRGLTTEV